MPVNWGPFLAGTEPQTTAKKSVEHLSSSGAPVDASTTYPDGVRTLVSQIVQKAFPQYVNRTNVTVKDTPSERGTVASYGGLNGNAVAAGNITGDIKTYSYKGKPVTGAYGATSDDVMEGVEVMLHELYHGRQASNKNATPNSSKLGKDWQNMLNDAQKAGFPSVGTNTFGGDNLEEFLATAVPISEMKQQGMTPTGRFKDIPKALDVLTSKYSWLPDYIKEQSDPESRKPDPTATDKAVSFLTNLFQR